MDAVSLVFLSVSTQVSTRGWHFLSSLVHFFLTSEALLGSHSPAASPELSYPGDMPLNLLPVSLLLPYPLISFLPLPLPLLSPSPILTVFLKGSQLSQKSC